MILNLNITLKPCLFIKSLLSCKGLETIQGGDRGRAVKREADQSDCAVEYMWKRREIKKILFIILYVIC